MIQALNYKLRNNGTIEMEIETRYLAGCRNVHAIVHVEHGWSKEFNLTSGVVTNITEDTDGDHDSDSILTRLEKLMDRMEKINQRIEELNKWYGAELNKLYDKYAEPRS